MKSVEKVWELSQKAQKESNPSIRSLIADLVEIFVSRFTEAEKALWADLMEQATTEGDQK